MSLYYIDPDLYTKTILPTDKRTPIHVSWLEALNSGMWWLNDILNKYIDGAIYPYYNSGTTYNKGDRVDGSPTNNNYIYESLTDSNIGNPLTDTTNWIAILTSSIGVNDRKWFSANKMTFEYALNDYFRTTFRQPSGVDTYGPRSDIYIDDNNTSIRSFFISSNPPVLYAIDYFYTWGSSGFITDGTYFYPDYQYTIYVPNSILGAYGEPAIRAIADKYNYYILHYEVIGY